MAVMSSLHKFLGLCLFQKKQTDYAIAELDLYVHAEPNDPEGHYFLGTALRDAGRQTDSESEFQQAEKLKSPSHQ